MISFNFYDTMEDGYLSFTYGKIERFEYVHRGREVTVWIQTQIFDYRYTWLIIYPYPIMFEVLPSIFSDTSESFMTLPFPA